MFKVDTGADSNLQRGAPEAEQSSVGNSRKDSVWICTITPQDLRSVQGQFPHKNTVVTQQVFVVNDLKTNLLGLPAISALQLAV